jgi:hypothetical protein
MVFDPPSAGAEGMTLGENVARIGLDGGLKTKKGQVEDHALRATRWEGPRKFASP